MKMKLLLGSVAFFLSALVFGQETGKLEIKGAVKDNKGVGLQGITITEKNTANVSITNGTGEFTIKVGSASATLVFSGVGFQTKETKIEEGKAVNILLNEDVKELSDVVVVGYGTQNKAKVTGATATLKMNDVLGDRPVTSLGALLQGATPGLQVTINSGAPGASTSWNIRGGTGFGSSPTSGINTSGPFIIVDNVPYNGPTNLLDPSDIETVTVLKDAGSAAIYGARSAFGVVVITTKSGKKNQKAQFNYSNNFVFATPNNLPVKATPIQQVQSWMDGGMAGTYYGQQNLVKWMELLQDYQQHPGNYPTGGTVFNNVYYQLAQADAIKDLLGHNSTQQIHNFSVNGGNDKTTYRLSFGTTNENGILVPEAKQDNFKRYNVKSIISSDINSWMNVQLDAGYYNATTTSPFYTDAFGTATNLPSPLPLDSLPTYPGRLIKSAKNLIMLTSPVVAKNSDVRITGRTILKPFKGMTVTGEYTIDNLNGQTTTYDKKPSGQYLEGYRYVEESIGNDKFSKNNSVTQYQALNIYATYLRSVGDHNFTLMGGFNQEENKFENQSVTASGLLSADLPFISGTTGLIPPVASDNYTEYATRGFFGRLNYDYQNKYLVQLNGRYDGSSKFPSGHRWALLPSASVGWRVMEENFMNFLKPVVNELKLRASFGSVGNQNIGDYQFYGGMTSSIPNWLYNSNRVGSLNTPPLVSDDFTWETVETKDLGIDWGFLKNKFTGSFDWYQRDTKDILTTNPTPLPSVLGTGAPLQNSGALRTRGFELEINWKDKVGKVTYNIGANLFNYKSVVTNVNNPQNVITGGYLYMGKRMGEIWGYTTERFYDEKDFVAGTLNTNLRGGTLLPKIAKQNGQAPNPGDILLSDLDTNGVINSGAGTLDNSGDLRVIGNSTPQYQYGITGSVSYANFDFSFVITGVGKQDLWVNNTLTFPNQWLTYGALYASQTNYWTSTNRNAHYGRIYTDNVNTPLQSYNQAVQTRFLLNGAYTRIKNVTLRYTIPAAVLKKAHISRLQLFTSVENVFTFSHMPEGMEPDVAAQGNTVGGGLGYPFMRKMSFGLNLSF